MCFGCGVQFDFGFYDSEFVFDVHVFIQCVEGNWLVLDRFGCEQVESFVVQIYNVFGVLCGDNDFVVFGEEGICSLCFIECCYNECYLFEMFWFDFVERVQVIELSEVMML